MSEERRRTDGEGGAELRLTPLLRCYFAQRDDLVRVFAARLGSRSAAEDLVQEIYLRLVRSAGEEGQVEQPSAYLFRLGANLAVDLSRSEVRRRRREVSWVREREPVQPSGEHAAISRDDLSKVLAAIARLKPRTQEVFRLHKLEGLGHAEVASRLGISRSAVEKHMAVALRAALEALR